MIEGITRPTVHGELRHQEPHRGLVADDVRVERRREHII